VQGAWDRDKAELAVSLVFGVFGVSGGAVLSLSVALSMRRKGHALFLPFVPNGLGGDHCRASHITNLLITRAPPSTNIAALHLAPRLHPLRTSPPLRLFTVTVAPEPTYFSARRACCTSTVALHRLF
jgi:hypothetical protein